MRPLGALGALVGGETLDNSALSLDLRLSNVLIFFHDGLLEERIHRASSAEALGEGGAGGGELIAEVCFSSCAISVRGFAVNCRQCCGRALARARTSVAGRCRHRGGGAVGKLLCREGREQERASANLWLARIPNARQRDRMRRRDLALAPGSAG